MTVAPTAPGIDDANVLRRGAGFTVATAIQALSTLLILPVLANMVTSAEVGTIAAGQLVMQLATLVAALGLPGLVTRDYFEGAGGPVRARRLVAVSMLLAPIVVGALHLAGPLWSVVFANLGYDTILVLALWAAWPRTAVTAALAVFRAERRVSAFVATSIASAVGPQIWGIAFLTAGGSLESFFVGFLLGHVIAAILAIVLSRPVLTGWSDDLRLAQAVRHSLPIAANSAAGLVLTTGDRVIIERTLGLAEVGRYQITYLVGSLGIVFLLAINNAWGPAVFSAPSGSQHRVLVATTRSVARVSMYLVVGIAAAGPVVLLLLAPASYRLSELSAVLAIVAAAALPLTFYLSGNHLALLHHQTGRLAIATAVAASANVAGNLVLIPRLGLEGAAATTLASYGIWAAMMHVNRASRDIVWKLQSLLPELLGTSGAVVLFAWAPAEGPWLAVRVLAAGIAAAAVVRLGRRSVSADLGVAHSA